MKKVDSEFLNYLVKKEISAGERLPTLSEIGIELGISVGKLREQLEVARSLGLVSVRPRVGIQREPYQFAPAILTSLLFGLGTGEAEFAQFSELRQAIEKSMWVHAAKQLTESDKQALREILARAWNKLRGNPIHVPNLEHRQLHLKIFSRLQNPFVQGILESYWEAYEASELTRFATYQYWVDVWTYHEKIVESIENSQFEDGRKLLVEHFSLLPNISAPVISSVQSNNRSPAIGS